jgi:hypothetical protein
MARKFGSDDVFLCSCGRIFLNKRALSSHTANTQDGLDHFPTGMS